MKQYIAGLALLASSWAVNANLITNGDFDSDLSGWTIEPTTGVTWGAGGTANVGQPRTPSATFSQMFDIATGTTSLAVGFDYSWQTSQPELPSVFAAVLSYQQGRPQLDPDLNEQEVVVVETNESSSSSSVTSFRGLVEIGDFLDGARTGAITFFLLEQDLTPSGTWIEIDNVDVRAVPPSVVPVPAAIWLFGTALIGLIGFGKRKSRIVA